MKFLVKCANKFKWRYLAFSVGFCILIFVLAGAAKSINEQYIETKFILDRDNSFVETVGTYNLFTKDIMILDEKNSEYEELYGEIFDKNEIVKQLVGVQKYVTINLGSDLERILDLADRTPLNLQESAILLGYCDKMEMKPSIILGLIETESNFNKFAVGTSKDRGYMQIIPDTEKWLAHRYGYRLYINYDSSNIFEPEYNFALGIIYLNHLKRVYGENYHKILSEYNRGPYNLKMYYNKHKTYQTSYSKLVLKKSEKYRAFD
ncbi:MAG TPA: transglycosylase SLT domain-containing protein [Clostridia bacterium]|nr:transglycosylase SLT domain-containing protein [Clostridia bacterium]